MLDVSLGFDAGGRFDPPARTGLASLTNAMLARGAGGLDEAAISEGFARIGAQRGGGTSDDRASVTAAHAHQRARAGRGAGAAGARGVAAGLPGRGPGAREGARDPVAARVRDQARDASRNETFDALLYGDHPYGVHATPEIGRSHRSRRSRRLSPWPLRRAQRGRGDDRRDQPRASAGDCRTAHARSSARRRAAQRSSRSSRCARRSSAASSIPAIAEPHPGRAAGDRTRRPRLLRAAGRQLRARRRRLRFATPRRSAREARAGLQRVFVLLAAAAAGSVHHRPADAQGADRAGARAGARDPGALPAGRADRGRAEAPRSRIWWADSRCASTPTARSSTTWR